MYKYVGGLVAKPCPTLGNPMDCSLPGSLSKGFSRQEYWSGLPFTSPGYLPHPGIEPGSPALQADFSPTELPGTIPRGGHGNVLQYSCLKNPHRQRSLADFSPWGCKESDMTEKLCVHVCMHTHTHTHTHTFFFIFFPIRFII